MNTKGAFGSCKLYGEGRTVMKRCSCYRCTRSSKFNKKNFPMKVIVDDKDEKGNKIKKLVGHLCKVCIRKAYTKRKG